MSLAPQMTETFTAAPSWRARAIAAAVEPMRIAITLTASAAQLALIGLASIGLVAVLAAFAGWLN